MMNEDVSKPRWMRDEVFRHSDFPFGIRRAYPQPEHHLHDHQHFSELVAIYAGHGVHFTETERYPLATGDVFVIAGDQKHGYTDLHDLHLVNIMFDPDRIVTQTSHIKKLPGYHVLFDLEPRYRRQHQFASRLRLGPNELDELMRMVGELEDELEEERAGYEHMVTARFMLMVGYLCRCYAGTSHPAGRSLMRIGEVISYLESNYAEPIDLELLQRIAGMSSSGLLRSFREATGYAPIDYLIRLRIARACHVLRTTDLPITETAFEVGFQDSNYFARQFRSIMGSSPSQYRRGIRPRVQAH